MLEKLDKLNQKLADPSFANVSTSKSKDAPKHSVPNNSKDVKKVLPRSDSKKTSMTEPEKATARSKSDIRHYGKVGEKSYVHSKDNITERIAKLRNSKLNDGLLPNINDRLTASN